MEVSKGGAYIFAIGRRKTAVAKVRLIKTGKGLITINGQPMESYFTTFETRNAITSPLKMAGQETAVDVSAEVSGGGMRGQSESVRLGISRALTELNPTYRKTLKKLGYLTRDPRAKERKKPGLKRARRAPQWSKR
ncbi:MAG: 30S ribosomal protein S9 [bacterium]|nr:30S ribosomal protein S9 [bacterium]